MKSAPAPKKKLKLMAKMSVHDISPRIMNACPGCEQILKHARFTGHPPLREEQVECKNCGLEVIVLVPDIEEEKKEPIAATPEKATDVFAQPEPKVGQAVRVEEVSPSYEGPTFGAEASAIDKALQEAADKEKNEEPDSDEPEQPSFPIFRTACLGAVMALVIGIGALYLAVEHWHLQIQPKPSPEVSDAGQHAEEAWNQAMAGKAVAVPDESASDQRVSRTPPPNAKSFHFLLKMNEGAWVSVVIDGVESVVGYIKKDNTVSTVAEGEVLVRCGKPGAISYFVDNQEVSPKNIAEKPDLVELVTLKAGMQTKEQ